MQIPVWLIFLLLFIFFDFEGLVIGLIIWTLFTPYCTMSTTVSFNAETDNNRKTNAMKKVEIFTDGSCDPTTKKGGWAAILKYNGNTKELFGTEEDTSNNRMELIAAIKGLEALTEPVKVTLTSDSQYLVNGMTTWLKGWLKNNWRTSNRKGVKNIDLWKKLHELSKTHDITFEWVKGHDGHEENERADFLSKPSNQET